MTAPMMSPEGAALRAAVRDLLDRFPDIPGPVIGRLNALARRHDLRSRHGEVARRSFLAEADTRGRWVRRIQGNGGPGVAGVAHVATRAFRTALDDAQASCGVVLRGRLEWSGEAALKPELAGGWRACARCSRLLVADIVEAVA